MKLGYINYLNCYPFYHHMFNFEPISGVDIIPAYPAELNLMMRNHELDMSPISAAEYSDIQDHACIIPDFCLSSVGYIRSVVLQSHLPIEELNGKKLGLTSASRTSINLLKIILKKYYRIEPVYVDVPPTPDMGKVDAALVIGNEAMIEPEVPLEYTYDLGDLWLRKTGYPVVFAIFTVQNRTAVSDKVLVDRVLDSYRTSLNYLNTDESALVKAASSRYPGIHYDISAYYRLFEFEFTDVLRKALLFYFQEASSLGLLRPVDRLRFYGLDHG